MIPDDCFVKFHLSPISCGVLQMYRLCNNPKHHMWALARRIEKTNHSNVPAFVIFSDVVGRNGTRLYEYLNKNRGCFGVVQETPTRVNTNSDNPIKMWVLSLNYKGLMAWYRLNKIIIGGIKNG